MKNIARLRKIKGWTQADLGEAAGINQATVSKAEKGDGGVSLNKYRDIADALGVPLYQLFIDDTSVAELRLLAAFRAKNEYHDRDWEALADEILKDRGQPHQ